MAKELGDTIGIVMVESQGATFDEMERFAWDNGWMGTSAMWTLERPVDSKSNYLPSYVLLDNNGYVLSRGNPIEDHGKIEDMIDEQLKLAKKAPDDAPKALDKAWKEFLGGKYQKGIEAAQKVAEKGDEDAEAAKALITEFEERIGTELALIERRIEAGWCVEAKSGYDAFSRAARGVEAVADRMKTVEEKFDSEDFKREFEAEEALNGILEDAHDDGITKKVVKKLEKHVERYDGTKAADRAKRLSGFANE
ncbi:MAG: hypothetical protein R3F34_08070 [Planctomycetota bacterium]